MFQSGKSHDDEVGIFQETRSSASFEVGRAKGNETILLVEDEPLVRKVVQRTLRRSGYAVLAAESAEDAIGMARHFTGSIHLLLVDVVMPRVSGPELADIVAGFRPGVRLLFMSGYTEQVLARHRMPLGSAARFVQKPLAPRLLLLKVREALDAGDC